MIDEQNPYGVDEQYVNNIPPEVQAVLDKGIEQTDPDILLCVTIVDEDGNSRHPTHDEFRAMGIRRVISSSRHIIRYDDGSVSPGREDALPPGILEEETLCGSYRQDSDVPPIMSVSAGPPDGGWPEDTEQDREDWAEYQRFLKRCVDEYLDQEDWEN